MKVNHRRLLIPIAIVFAVAAVTTFAGSDYQTYVLSLAGIFSMLTLGLNVSMGLCGLISLGHAAFFGIGAYTTAILLVRVNIPFIPSLIMGGLVAAVFGALLGIPSLKVRAFYLAITTIGFNQIVALILNNWVALTRGPDGFPGIPLPSIGPFVFESPLAKYMLIMFFLLLSVWAFSRLKESRVGRGFQAIRDNDLAAALMGIDVHYYKVLAFALGAFVSGIAGGLYASFMGYISPDTFAPATSTLVVSMLLVGGPGSVWGPVFGGFVLEILPEWMRFLEDYYMALYGLIVVLVALKMPGGLNELFRRAAARIRSWRPGRRGDAVAGKGA